MTDFRDAIASSLLSTENRMTDPDQYDWCSSFPAEAGADDILAMPEMQAIRKALRRLSAHFSEKVTTATLLRRAGLPEPVVAWVLGEPTP